MLHWPRSEPLNRPQPTVLSRNTPPPPRNMDAPVELIDLTRDDSPPPPPYHSRPHSSTPFGFERPSPSVRSRAGSARRTPAARPEARRRTAVHINDIIDHDVIDVDSLPDRPPERAPERAAYVPFDRNSARINSPEPEIEITFARARFSRPPSQQPGNYRSQHGNAGPSTSLPSSIFMENIQFPEPPRSHGGRGLFTQLEAISRAGGGLMQLLTRSINPPARMRPEHHRPQHYFNAPIGLDYGLRDRILGDPPREDPPPRPSMPQDKPLPAVREGFTRDPVPDDAIVCPECDEELGNSDDEAARAIWVGKCGHCYCGTCAQKILHPVATAQPGSKRKRATKPTCSVDGCRQTFNGKKTFWELYI